MRPTVFQRAELRDENDNIVQQGTYGKGSALSNSTNDGWIDYVMNNLEALRSMSVGAVIPVETLPESGETGKSYVVTTGTNAGKLFMWDGEDWVEITGSIGDYLPITGGTITGNLAVEGNLTAVTQLPNDNSTKAATTEYVQNEVKPIETDVDIAEKDIANIKALLQGHLYNYQTDSTSGYIKSVPAGAMPYAGLEKVGGKTIVYNQLCNFPASTTISGLTFTKNSDNTYTVNGTSTGDVAFPLSATINIPTTHQILVKGCPAGGSTTGSAVFFLRNAYEAYAGVHADIGNGYIYTNREDTRVYLRFECSEGVTFNNAVLKPFMCDLTLMFGAGNEPTIEQFNALFPADFYPYNAGTLLSAGVTSVVSKDTNNATLQTYSVPAEVQALEGYGWSAGSAYNYVDFERKVFVKNVGSRSYSSGDESDSTVITDGTTTYYPLTTAVETDISAYITDDNLIQVESGGILTFPNQNGTDYRLPVPSEEEYMIDLQEALS